jgi:hypothetical protein
MTIREIIKQKSEELRSIDAMGAAKASEELVNLSSLLASLNAYIVEKHFAYNLKSQEMRKLNKTAADAKIAASASTEWKEWNEALAQKEALIELIRSVKYFLKSSEQEGKEARYN